MTEPKQKAASTILVTLRIKSPHVLRPAIGESRPSLSVARVLRHIGEGGNRVDVVATAVEEWGETAVML